MNQRDRNGREGEGSRRPKPKCLCFLPAIVFDVGMIANVQFPVLAPLNEEDNCGATRNGEILLLLLLFYSGGGEGVAELVYPDTAAAVDHDKRSARERGNEGNAP